MFKTDCLFFKIFEFGKKGKTCTCTATTYGKCDMCPFYKSKEIYKFNEDGGVVKR